MKKVLLILFFLFVGCSNQMANTPAKKVEMFFQKYQALDKEVLKDLDNVVDNDLSLTKKQKKEYKEIMKRHYQTLKYEIKDEIINDDTATVFASIEVIDYSKILNDTNEYKETHKEEFYNEGVYDEKLFNDYRLEKLKKAEDKIKFMIDITLTKEKDGWVIDHIPDDIQEKINGIYIY